MDLIRLDTNHELWPQVWELYENSFPPYERRTAELQEQTMRRTDYNACAALNGRGELTALLFWWETDEQIYVEHIAVRPEMRGQNIGSELMRRLIDLSRHRRIILEIDLPIDEVSKRRKGFYQRLGFNPNERYSYIHPSYATEGEIQPHELVLMSYPDPLTEEQAEYFMRYMTSHVLSDANEVFLKLSPAGR